MNLDRLAGHIPAKVLSEVKVVSATHGVNTPLRMAHFLAQCAHESGNFLRVTENLNYSAEGLSKTFPTHFTAAECVTYAHKPAEIGAKAYANRMGNGNQLSGEGYKYRGRGYIQLTGKENYSLFAKFIGEDVVANPDLVATRYPLVSAVFFFNQRKIWAACDCGGADKDVKAVTKKVNGGTLGLVERLKYFKLFYGVLRGA